MAASRADVAAIVVGGGGGERLGGVSKPDLTLGGVRVIDRVCGVLLQVCGAGCVAVVPPTVRVPEGVMRTLEDPPSGGPLAGIDAGLRALGVDDDVLVVVVSVDAPLTLRPQRRIQEGGQKACHAGRIAVSYTHLTLPTICSV